MRFAASTGTDVLVAGSGAAGLTAALAAAVGGARVLLAERSPQLGGTTALSFGRVWVPANHYCPDDTPDAGRRYLTSVYGADYPRMIDAFVAAAPLMARFAERRSPLVFTPCENYPDYHPAVPGAARGGRALDITPVSRSSLTPLADALRTPPGYLPLTHDDWERWRFPHRFDWPLLAERSRDGVLAGGAALAAALLDGAVAAGVQVRASTRLHGVRLGQDGAVSAATVSADGQTEDVPVSAVILATGGFDRDASLRARFLPASVAATGAAPGNTGDALRIAAAVNARIENTGQGWWMPMVEIPGQTIDGQPYYQSLIRERALPHQIVVSTAGCRFTDEALPYNEFCKAMNGRNAAGGYPNRVAWMIFDETFRRRYTFPETRPGGGIPGWVHVAGSLAGLATATGLPGDALAETVERWNRNCAAGYDPDFGRGCGAYERFMGDPEAPHPNLGPLAQPPYYAVRVRSGTIGTKGGPATDENARVLTQAGHPVPGLYAAGNAAAFWTADGYPGAGATLGVAMTMGYLAGRHAAARASSAWALRSDA